MTLAEQLVRSSMMLLGTQDQLLAEAIENAKRQRHTAAAMVTASTATIALVDQATISIGQLSSNAMAVRLLAKQLVRNSAEGAAG